MFGELLKQWANEQGFDGWSRDHAAVLRNLVKWLNMHAVQQSVHPTAFRRGLFLGWFVTAVIHIVAALLFGGG